MAFSCPKCKEEFYDRLKYCPECGYDFTANQKKCPKCRTQVAKDAKKCPECDLDFEQYAYFVPRMVVFGSTVLVVIMVLVAPVVWTRVPAFHDTGVVTDGLLRSSQEGMAMVPLFIAHQTGVRYIEEAQKNTGSGHSTDYMNSLVPLPPMVVFHYDVPQGEKVWIIRRVRSGGQTWLNVGRWGESRPGKFGWLHVSNVLVEE